MESKHTKGPWILYTRTTLPPMIGSTEHIVCEVLSAPTREEEDANAKLIAAAPDLLEAIQAVYLHLRDGVQTGETAALYNQVCAALAKAS